MCRNGCDRRAVARGLCPACWQRTRKRNIAYGRWDPQRNVPADDVREHIRVCCAAGLNQRTVAAIAGVSLRTVADAATGRRSHLAPDNARKILAVDPWSTEWHLLPPGALVPDTGTVRRLRALMAIGWSGAKLAADLGWKPEQLNRVRAGRQRTVTAGTAIAVRDLYDRLWSVDGGYQRVRTLAALNGWALPMEWDDIDDPDEVPSGRRQLFGQQRGKRLDRREQVEAWMDDPRPDWAKDTAEQVADRLGVRPRTIERDKALIRRQRAEQERAA